MDSKREAPESTARRPSFLRSPLLGAALVASLAGCASEPPDDPDVGSTAEDIIGGFPITSPKLNAIGALGFDVGGGIFVPFCSGTLISPTMVVTAKHCVNFITDPSPFAFLVGPSALAPIRVVPARGAAVEPTFPEIGVVGLGSDVGILHLAQPVTDVTPLPFAALTDDQIGNRLVGVGYGVQNSDGASGTRMGGSMTLKATGGSVYAAAFDSFEGFVQEGAPKLFPELDPTNPDDLAVLQQIFDETVLIDGIEGWFGSGPQDAQICFGDSGGPITRKVGTTTTLFGVASWVFSLDGSTCELDGGAYASMNPVSLDFIDYETHCPLVPRAGTCDGLTVAIRCTNPNEGGRRIVTTDCDQLGLLCALDESGAVGCTDDPCEGLPAGGTCEADVAVRCSFPDEGPRHVVHTDCAAQGDSCLIEDGSAACVDTTPCEHDLCTSGDNLESFCSECSAEICAADAFCCLVAWDEICIDEVQTVCGSDECVAPPVCLHDKCTAGPPLEPACGACETAICEVDGFCCNEQWDSVCVAEVQSICDETCPGMAGIDIADIQVRQHSRRR